MADAVALLKLAEVPNLFTFALQIYEKSFILPKFFG